MRARLQLAWPATLLVHAIGMSCALAAAWPLASGAAAGVVQDSPAVGALSTAMRLAEALLAAPQRYLLLPLLVMIAWTPFLRVLWFSALAERAPLHEHGQRAWRSLRSAFGVWCVVLVFQAALVLLAWLAARAAHHLLAFSHDLRLQDCAALLIALPFLAMASVFAPTAGDLAHARLARGLMSVRRAISVGLLAIDARACGVRALCDLAVLLLAVCALTARLWLGPGAFWAAVCVSQLCALGQTLLRLVFCAWLLERVARRVSRLTSAQ